jgi:hypothetical protein
MWVQGLCASGVGTLPMPHYLSVWQSGGPAQATRRAPTRVPRSLPLCHYVYVRRLWHLAGHPAPGWIHNIRPQLCAGAFASRPRPRFRPDT